MYIILRMELLRLSDKMFEIKLIHGNDRHNKGTFGSWKTWKVMEFEKRKFKSWKVLDFEIKSLKVMEYKNLCH